MNVRELAAIRNMYCDQWRSQDLEVGAQRVWGREDPSGVQAHSILRTFGCQTMHNFVYLAKLLKTLVKHEKPRLFCVIACRVVNCN